jgi:hypothetical protein
MTQEEKRIKIAEAVGEWIPSTISKGKWCHKSNYSMALNGAYSVWVGKDSLPDYFNDLNAMHEAEKSLSDGQYSTFCDHLYDFAREEQLQTGKWRWLSSMASQRAEAFGRTLNLW